MQYRTESETSCESRLNLYCLNDAQLMVIRSVAHRYALSISKADQLDYLQGAFQFVIISNNLQGVYYSVSQASYTLNTFKCHG